MKMELKKCLKQIIRNSPGLLAVMVVGNFMIFQSCQQSDKELNFMLAYNVLLDTAGDNYEIFITDLEGKQHKNITNNEDVAWTYNAGTNTVFFISDRDTCNRCGYFLYEMHPDGSGVRKISDLNLRDSWMNTRFNDDEIIVYPRKEIDSAFYIIDRQGNIINKIPVKLPYANSPAFSPDGSLIAYIGANKKSKREENFDDEIYLMKADGSERQRLTTFPKNDTLRPWYAYKAGPPVWHPSGEFISYQSYQRGKYRLFKVDINTSEEEELIVLKENVGYHSWSPDGKWLALGIADSTNSYYDIAIINWQTKKLKVLSDSTYQYEHAPVFVTLE